MRFEHILSFSKIEGSVILNWTFCTTLASNILIEMKADLLYHVLISQKMLKRFPTEENQRVSTV